jgi:uncharacterized coiled-coil protein SlyX
MVLLTTGTSTRWVATSSLGISGGPGGSLFTDAGATTYLTALGDNLAIGSTTATEKLSIAGNVNLDGNYGLSINGIRQLTADTVTKSLALGEGAGEFFDAGTPNNIAIGYQAYQNASSSWSDNTTALGYQTGQNALITGGILIGRDAGKFAYYSVDDISIGYQAGMVNQAEKNIFLGYQAGASTTDFFSEFNTMIGYRAGFGSEGDNNVLIGSEAGRNNTENDTVMIGKNAGFNNSGYAGIILGVGAGYTNSGSDSIIIGDLAGQTNTGNENVMIGAGAGSGNTGFLNFFGNNSGGANTGSFNVMIGGNAGAANTGSYNNFFGAAAGQSNRGNGNNFLGYEAGNVNSGRYNNFLGYNTGRNLRATTSDIIGTEAFRGSSTYSAQNNVALGYRAGFTAIAGASNNILIGYQAADNLTSGTNNIVIGYDINLPTAAGTQQLVIGNMIYGTGINGTGSTLSTGKIGIGTSSPTAQFSTTGSVRFSNFGAGTLQTDASGNLSVSSDERLKDVLGDFTSDISAILALKPIEYRWNELSGFETKTTYVGFSAQNVKESIPQAVGSDKNGYLTLSDRGILAAVVNAVKELWERIEETSNKVDELENTVTNLQSELDQKDTALDALTDRFETLESALDVETEEDTPITPDSVHRSL